MCRNGKLSRLTMSIRKEAKTISDVFELTRRVHEQLNSLYAPLMENQDFFNDFYKSTNWIKEYQQQFDFLDISHTVPLDLSTLFQNPARQLAESIACSRELINHNLISEVLVQKTFEWQSILSQINNPEFFGTLIPREINSSLNEFTNELEGNLDASSDLPAGITVESTASLEEHNVTWYQLLMILLAFLPIIVQYHINYMNSIQQNTQDQELQTDSKHQIELTEQLVSIERERLMLDQKQKDLENKFDVLMKSIEPLIPERPSVPEVDQ